MTCKIPVDKQVLLISGGESLDPVAKVGSYSSGTVSFILSILWRSILSLCQDICVCQFQERDIEVKIIHLLSVYHFAGHESNIFVQ